MVDEGRVARLLRSTSERTDRLRAAAQRLDADRDELWLDAVKYLFITAIEGCVDVAHHIVAAERYRAPDSNADALRLLGEHGIIEPALAASLSRSVGFRNVLVHQYAAVDDDVVLAALTRLDELDRFVAEVSRWLVADRD